MSPTYKLTYFNLKGRGEPIRLCFAFAGIPFEDKRINPPDWPSLKPSFTWGTVPVLEVDGKVLCQSMAITRFVGKRFNLAGDNDFEAAKCDEMLEVMVDIGNSFQPLMKESDEGKKKEMAAKLVEETFPKYLGKLCEILVSNGGFLVGKRLSVADITVASYLQFFNEKLGNQNILQKYSALAAHQEKVFNEPKIKAWIDAHL